MYSRVIIYEKKYVKNKLMLIETVFLPRNIDVWKEKEAWARIQNLIY